MTACNSECLTEYARWSIGHFFAPQPTATFSERTVWLEGVEVAIETQTLSQWNYN
jgi:hypothetical protein